jgi:hypothetical protein
MGGARPAARWGRPGGLPRGPQPAAAQSVEVGRLELRPTSRTGASSRPHPGVHLRFLATGRDRWCPLRSPGRRSGVYPACTAGSGPSGHGRLWRSAPRPGGQIDRPGATKPVVALVAKRPPAPIARSNRSASWRRREGAGGGRCGAVRSCPRLTGRAWSSASPARPTVTSLEGTSEPACESVWRPPARLAAVAR